VIVSTDDRIPELGRGNSLQTEFVGCNVYYVERPARPAQAPAITLC
jgi:hypothetical protein